MLNLEKTFYGPRVVRKIDNINLILIYINEISRLKEYLEANLFMIQNAYCSNFRDFTLLTVIIFKENNHKL